MSGASVEVLYVSASVSNRRKRAKAPATIAVMEAAAAPQFEQHPADDPKLRETQRARLEQLRKELVAEGADPSKHLPELQRRADTWPE